MTDLDAKGLDRVERIAECIWQAEWKRAGNGGPRKVPWSEIAPADHERYRFVAREISEVLPPCDGVGVKARVERNQPGHYDSGGRVVADFGNDAEMSAILSALTAVPVAGEAVAWRWRWPQGVWNYQEAKQVIPGVEEMEPLYASPVPVERGTVDALAQEIRRIDGNHSLGAGALAEALMPFLASLSSPALSTDGETESARDALKLIRKANDQLVIAYKGGSYKSEINMAMHRLTAAERALSSHSPNPTEAKEG